MKSEETLKLQGVMRKGYGLAPKAVMVDRSLPDRSRLLYAFLSSFTGGGATAYPSVRYTCDCLGWSENTYYKYREPLERAGLIVVSKSYSGGHRANNVYTLPIVPQPTDEKSRECADERTHSNPSNFEGFNFQCIENCGGNNNSLSITRDSSNNTTHTHAENRQPQDAPRAGAHEAAEAACACEDAGKNQGFEEKCPRCRSERETSGTITVEASQGSAAHPGKREKRPSLDEYTDLFLSAYPKRLSGKTTRRGVRKALRAVLSAGVPIGHVCSRAVEYGAYERSQGRSERYMVNAIDWLNAGGWETSYDSATDARQKAHANGAAGGRGESDFATTPTAKCPCCGSIAKRDVGQGNYYCEHCGGVVHGVASKHEIRVA